MPERRPRGFAAMDPEQQRQIASMGGRAAHQRGTAHEWDSREAADAGRKGGKAAHHRGSRAERVTTAAQENGQPRAHEEEASRTIATRPVDAAMSIPDSRREHPGQSGPIPSEGHRRGQTQWSENEYENGGAPGSSLAITGSPASAMG